MTGKSTGSSCCMPKTANVFATDQEPGLRQVQRTGQDAAPPLQRWCHIPQGTFVMGNNGPDAIAEDGESPARLVELDAFLISATTVSNAEFAAFVRATHYITDAEQAGESFVFYWQVPDSERRHVRQVVSGLPWWLPVANASWQRPEGPHSHIHERLDHPAVHVSWNDAVAYCAWAGVSLPSEPQWERAARGGLEGKRFAWGDDLHDADGKLRCNIFRGDFPHQPESGWLPGPVTCDAGEPNGFGLFNVCGNVWEWCANPVAEAVYPLRGGSFLCHDSYCNRYRVAARTFNSQSTSASNIGFRVSRPNPSPCPIHKGSG